MSQCSILLLEDEPLILMDLEFAAEDRECSALCAADVATAMKHIEGERVDVAILDVTLKGKETCVPVAQELDKRGIPYILHSGDLNRADETVRNLGAQHLPKPADSDVVIGAAMDLLEKSTASVA
ncbi:response regulator [Aurantiacibacter poecillastricola]|uniref:response regulator n=1 Tax=Aurantiacibacter poecillastricola TaxID=3064385 RepID=UPI00273F68CA|nr:response regulator [Aurantiacibacter sp. 219JJ12-13]MDP5262676.1 response regulator [Aurantiacibacter sp. 219JJ12-13]